MARKTPRPAPTEERTLRPLRKTCPLCERTTWYAYLNYRTVTTLEAVIHLVLEIRRCPNPLCGHYHVPYRPEAEGRLALPQHEFGLDVIALIGALRYAEHRSVPEIHQALRARGVEISQRSVTNLLARYDELVSLSVGDRSHLQEIFERQGRVILSIDGLQPDVGHEVLWVIREVLSGEVILARSLLSSTEADLQGLLREATAVLTVPVVGVISDGEQTIRLAVGKVLAGVPHQLCHYHYLEQAAGPIYEADRHAKKELKKRVRGVRPIERAVEGRDDEEAQIIQGYCAAVRSALSDDGHPPLDASGLKLYHRLSAIAESLAHAAQQQPLPKELAQMQRILNKGLTATADLWPDIETAYAWVHEAATLLDPDDETTPPEPSADPAATAAAATASGSGAPQTVGQEVQQRYEALLQQMRTHAAEVPSLQTAIEHFLTVTESFYPGLFHCYDVADLPRTNNDLEQLFGSVRYHERRATGRKTAAPGLVIRGPVRLVASVATRLHTFAAEQLVPSSIKAWHHLRQTLDMRGFARTLRYRFRHDPEAYLHRLEERLDKLILPT